MAALLLTNSAKLRYLNFSSSLNVYVCSVLMPSLKENRSSLGPPRINTGISMTPLTHTAPLRAELLTATRTDQPTSVCLVSVLSLSTTTVCTRSAQGAKNEVQFGLGRRSVIPRALASRQ